MPAASPKVLLRLADRCHLLKNLRETLEKLIERQIQQKQLRNKTESSKSAMVVRSCVIKVAGDPMKSVGLANPFDLLDFFR
jgi:hypothetical protein